MKIAIGFNSESGILPSTHQIGARVKFQPDVSKINADGTCLDGTYAEVLRVSFDFGKVMYDLAVINPNNNEPYYPYPLRNVDSYFVFTVNTDGQAGGTNYPQMGVAVDPTPVTDAIGLIDTIVSESLNNFKSESKGKSKKAKTPRQMLYSVMMRELAGVRGEELANLMVKGDEDKLQEEFGKSVTNMLKDFKKKVK